MGWEVGGMFKREGTYVLTMAVILLMYGRNQYNIVNQLSSNLKKMNS